MILWMHFSRNPKIALYMRSYKLVKEGCGDYGKDYGKDSEFDNKEP